jgi:outer membrane protein OmpA-like peptidoglycan-associated protein
MKTAMKTMALVMVGLAAAGCTTIDPVTGETVRSNTGTGALIGAVGGAVLGAAAGGDDRRNAVIGAGIGALAGAAVGNYMDRQEAQLRERMRGTGVTVTRTADNEITLEMPNDITFDFNRADVKPQFAQTLQGVARNLADFSSTTVDVVGHTDSIGSDAYNLTLSQRRADAVASQLTAYGVQPVRIVAVGKGEALPIAPNTTDAGRAQNRRVEVKVRALERPNS